MTPKIYQGSIAEPFLAVRKIMANIAKASKKGEKNELVVKKTACF